MKGKAVLRFQLYLGYIFQSGAEVWMKNAPLSQISKNVPSSPSFMQRCSKSCSGSSADVYSLHAWFIYSQTTPFQQRPFMGQTESKIFPVDIRHKNGVVSTSLALKAMEETPFLEYENIKGTVSSVMSYPNTWWKLWLECVLSYDTTISSSHTQVILTHTQQIQVGFMVTVGKVAFISLSWSFCLFLLPFIIMWDEGKD